MAAVLPELLGRKDYDLRGEWTIVPCAADRGAPMTAISLREMHVPIGDNPTARRIRAHEMMHAKLSPWNHQPWVDRGIASDEALQMAEEARVNFVCKAAGFDMEELITQADKQMAEAVCAEGSFRDAVLMAVALHGLKGYTAYMRIIKQHNPDWAESIKIVTRKVRKMLREADKLGREGLRSTEPFPKKAREPIGPYGYIFTERIAEYIDRVIDMEQQMREQAEREAAEAAEREQAEQARQKAAKRAAEEAQAPEQPEESPHGAGDGEVKAPKVAKRAAEEVNPVKQGQKWRDQPEAGWWATLVPEELSLTKPHRGGLGRKRVPSNRGRFPRHPQRMLTDPHRRIFERRMKGQGGVVLLDGSASIRFSQQELEDMVEAAPGATVAIYSTQHDDGKPNLFIVARNGKMTADLPQRRGGNGVDGPALRWAIDQAKPGEPILWVTDGEVHGPHQAPDANIDLAIDCMKVVRRNNVVVVGSAKHAVEWLKAKAAGRTLNFPWPYWWRSLRERFGV